VARVFFIVARDHPELLVSLRKEFAAQEAAGLAEIFIDRRQNPSQAGVQPREAESHRRDERRNLRVSQDLRGLGCAIVRLSEPLS
jgi:hypothetical protein